VLHNSKLHLKTIKIQKKLYQYNKKFTDEPDDSKYRYLYTIVSQKIKSFRQFENIIVL